MGGWTCIKQSSPPAIRIDPSTAYRESLRLPTSFSRFETVSIADRSKELRPNRTCAEPRSVRFSSCSRLEDPDLPGLEGDDSNALLESVRQSVVAPEDWDQH
jgi:hypothetical protein